MLYVHVYLLARLWYVDRYSRPSTVHTTDHCSRHIYYMARGHVPSTRLQTTSRQTDGGRALLDITAKCRALFLNRMNVHGARPGTVMAAWLHNCGLNERPPNPKIVTAYPT